MKLVDRLSCPGCVVVGGVVTSLCNFPIDPGGFDCQNRCLGGKQSAMTMPKVRTFERQVTNVVDLEKVQA